MNPVIPIKSAEMRPKGNESVANTMDKTALRKEVKQRIKANFGKLTGWQQDLLAQIELS